MKKYYIVLALAVGLNGCAGIHQPGVGDNIYTQASRLESAKKLIKENKVSAASVILNSICSAKGIPGITDEAMFRLALLYLGEGQGKNEIIQAQQTLEKLQKEFPSSSWKTHAASLTELIATLNRKIRNLKDENVSLSRENRELRLNIEKLKPLSKENRELRLNIEKLKVLDVEQELKEKR
jgi:cell division protein FtsB